MKTKLFTLLSAGALIFAIGCGDSQDVDDGTDSGSSDQDGATEQDSAITQDSSPGEDSATTQDSSPGEDGATEQDSDPGADTGPIECDTKTNHVLVTYAGGQSCVDLDPLEVVKFKGTNDAHKLADVWKATLFKVSVAGKKFDFVGNDGFQSSSRGPCKALLEGEKFEKGFILKANKNLVWNEGDDVPKCFAVKNAAKIIAAD